MRIDGCGDGRRRSEVRSQRSEIRDHPRLNPLRGAPDGAIQLGKEVGSRSGIFCASFIFVMADVGTLSLYKPPRRPNTISQIYPGGMAGGFHRASGGGTDTHVLLSSGPQINRLRV